METTATILLAEDNTDDVALFRWALQRASPAYRLQVVHDGAQAILYLKGEGPYSDRERFPLPKLVFLDVQMPIKTGLDVLAWVRQQPKFEKLVVIVLTQSSFDSTVRTAYALGANSFLTKPSNYTDFAAEIKQLTDAWLALSPPARPAASVAAEPLSDVSAPNRSKDAQQEAV